MSRPVRRKAIAAPILLLAALSLGCVAQGGQFRATAAYGVGYYGPVGYNFGGWGPRYRVAPYRAAIGGVPVVRGRRAPHAFRAAPFGRPVPSIPWRSRARTAAAYGVGYFGPVGYNFGAWGPSYRVAPYRAPFGGPAFRRGRKAPHAFHAAPGSRAVPSIPWRRRA